MPSTKRNSVHKFDAVKKRLLVEQSNLSHRIQGRLGDVFIEHEPDDEAAEATYSVTRDMTAATIERERETLAEIEGALKRIKNGDYGVCESCGTPISDARLKALPWARMCISCANHNTTSDVRLRIAS